MHEQGGNIIGKCLQMCPEDEVKMRTRERLVHSIELKHGQLIKCFKRSAAGVDTSSPKLLRPPYILQETVTFLFNEILIDKSFPIHSIYGFVEDRLRSVRQDLFIQQPSSDKCFPILEPIVRFYAYFAYRLCEHDLKDFDPVINHNQLLETFKWLLKLYDESGHRSIERIEMEALFVVFNLGEPSSLLRSLSLNSKLRHNLVVSAEKISIAWYLGNYAKVFKDFMNLPILMSALLYSVQSPYIQRYALKVICSAYSSKNLTFPITEIKEKLFFCTEAKTKEYLRTCGTEIIEKTVKFSKQNCFDKLPLCSKLDTIEKKLEDNYLPDLLLTTCMSEKYYK